MTTNVFVLDAPSPTKRPKSTLQPVFLESYERVREALRVSSVHHIWIVASNDRFVDLVRAVTEVGRDVYRFKLFSYQRPDPSTAVVIESAFGQSLLGPTAVVPFDELLEILQEERPEDFCIAAQWIEASKSVALWRGDFTMLAVPLAWFSAVGAPAPSPTCLSVEDFGRTIRLGDFEASFDAVLYEHDAASRRRMRDRMRKSDQSLGGSIRRLRELRGIRRREFGEIDEKTIARIERGEVKKPQQATLEKIAARLGVSVDELGTY